MDAREAQVLRANGIRVILPSLHDFVIQLEPEPEYIRKNYSLVDDGTDNVLRYIDEFSSEVDEFLNHGLRILVHCAQGVSRSVALVTGYLMKKRRMSFQESYSFIQKVYPPANMADNFRDQLIIYGDSLDWDVSLNTQKHRLYRAKKHIEIKSPNLVPYQTNPKERYLCRKCRQSLFLDIHMVPSPNTNYLIECMRWMNVEFSEGPICCPKCQLKIGHYNWSGSEENSFDGPVFIITKSKVDEMPLTSRHFGDSFPLTRF